jgi:hypothetical protein
MLDRELAETGVVMIAPHRRNRTNRAQDGRFLRRYRHRWKIERLFAWLQNYRRLVTLLLSHCHPYAGIMNNSAVFRGVPR